MRQRKLGICDPDIRYAVSLMNYINADIGNSFLAFAFSTRESLSEYLTGNHLDLVLVAEDWMADAAFWDTYTELCVIGMSEHSAENVICKYEDADKIVQDILRFFRAGCKSLSSELFCSYAVISPLGRCGKTRLSKCICYLDEVRGGLYIGFEAYGLSAVIGEAQERYTMSELAYLIKTRSDQILDYVERSVIADGKMGVIDSPRSYLDIRNLDAADMCWFLDRLYAWGRYTTIVCDIDGGVLGDNSVLEAFDYVIVPVFDEAYAKEKVKVFRNCLKRQELGKIVIRMKCVEVPNAEYDSAEMIRCAGNLMEENGRGGSRSCYGTGNKE